MNKNIILLAAGAVMLSVASCSVEESKLTPVASDPRVPMEFTTLSTKTALVPSDNNAVVWSADDAVAIFDGTYANKFTITSEPGTPSATFAGKAIPEADYYAIYPFSNDAELNGTVISSVLPAEQHYVAGTFDTMLNPSVAKALGGATELSFSNVASILQVNVENLGDKVVKEVAVKATEKLAGDYTVEMSGDEYIAKAAENAVAEVKVVADEAVAADKFYAVLLPGTYTGLVVTVTYSDGTYSEKAVSSSVEMPVSGGRSVSIDASAAVAIENGLYGQYQAGLDIEIGGKLYNKEKFGEATLVSTDTELTEAFKNNDAAIFIDGDAVLTWSTEKASKNVLIVGNNPDKKSKVIINQYIRCNAVLSGVIDQNAEFVVFNVDMEPGQKLAQNYLIFNNTDTPSTVRIVDSKFNVGDHRVFRATDARSWHTIEIIGSTICLGSTTTFPFINPDGSTGTFTNIIFKDNVFYSSEGVNNGYKLFNVTSNGAVTVEKVVMENNTFINIHDETAGLFSNYEYLNEVELRNNLVYVETQTTGICFFRPLARTAVAQDPEQVGNKDKDPVYVGNPEKGTCEKSLFYAADQSTKNKQWFYSGMNRVKLTEEKEFEPLTENPFVALDINAENFTLKEQYAEYGAQR